MNYSLPELPYPYEALEPHYSEQMLRLHHGAHHKAYVDGLNKAETRLQEARKEGDFSLVKHWERELAFHGSGHMLHTLFWENMSPQGGGSPEGPAAKQIEKDLEGFEAFKKQFSAAAAALEGSGWVLLCWHKRFHRLMILTSEKHQNLTLWGAEPLLVLDMWEHAYYLQYHNKKADFIEAWWNLVNWDDVNRKLEEAY